MRHLLTRASRHRRPLYTAPLLLLGAALLLRSRLPHPAAPHDAWLWQLVETSHSVSFWYLVPAQRAPDLDARKRAIVWVTVKGRQEMRQLLRALATTEPLRPSSLTINDMQYRGVSVLAIDNRTLWIIEKSHWSHRYSLYDVETRREANMSSRALESFGKVALPLLQQGKREQEAQAEAEAR